MTNFQVPISIPTLTIIAIVPMVLIPISIAAIDSMAILRDATTGALSKVGVEERRPTGASSGARAEELASILAFYRTTWISQVRS